MARIRTIKPEFWEDDVIGCLTRDERLLFIATWSLADDEGLLRWSSAYLKSSAFIYDDDITAPKVERMMAKLVEAGLIFAYVGGKAQQPFSYIVNFHKHQRINRPSPSRLPPPPLQDSPIKDMYGRRDGWRCHLCLGEIDKKYSGNNDLLISVDHIIPISNGGSDYPSNIKASHVTCNKGRGNRSIESYRELLKNGKTSAQRLYPERFKHTLSEQFSDSLIERPPLEREGEREVEGEVDLVPSIKEDSLLTQGSVSKENGLSLAVELWNDFAKKHGLADVRKISQARKSKLTARLKDCGGLDGWKAALEKVASSPGLLGKANGNGHAGWRCSFDFLLSDQKFTRLMEGTYDTWGMNEDAALAKSAGDWLRKQKELKNEPDDGEDSAGVLDSDDGNFLPAPERG